MELIALNNSSSHIDFDELFLLFKNDNKKQPATAAALKRTLEALMDRGAIVRNLENLGERALPYKISAHSEQHWRGG